MISQEIIHDIIESVLEQGALTKTQLLESWGIAPGDYAEVQERVLKNRRMECGPPGTGGFVAKSSRSRAVVDETSGDDIFLPTQWERLAVQRLEELLTRPQLEELVGRLKNPLRQIRYHEKRIDQPSTKRELAAALILKHGIDLFCESDVRTRVAVACKKKPLRRWNSGKQAAIEFVQETGFPAELAGLPSPESLEDYEYLEENFKLRDLLDFQHEVKHGLRDTLSRPGARAIVTLPTGAGKTRVAVESIRDWLTFRYDAGTKSTVNSAVLWLAHTEELCEQAYTCFKQVWSASSHVCPLLLVRFWGKYTHDLVKHRPVLEQALTHPSVLISTPQRMVNLLSGHVHLSDVVIQNLKSAIGVLLIDEAHRAAAPSYRRIMDGLLTPQTSVSVAGLTATPFRMEYLGNDPEVGTRELQEIFGALIEPKKTLGNDARQRLQERGILARPIFETIATPTTMYIPNVPKLDEFSEHDIERLDRVLAQNADKTPRRLAILEHLLPIARDEGNSILYFGPSVPDAECMAYLLRRAGIPAAVISGETRDVTRRQVVAGFKEGSIRVLCNYNVLTTGFDAPRVTHVVMARPTVSRVLYEQILGRGLRGPVFGGTETCTILDCLDNFKGDRPPLGYESFRRVWEDEVSRNSALLDRVTFDEMDLALQASI
jgi:superfamily II DNA or RNA helicase